MSQDAQLAASVREQFPDGLTGIFAIGGTRTAYILERNRHRADPGQIEDFADYAQYTLDQYMRLVTDFFALGGQNLIIPPLSYQAFYERGEEYTEVILDYTRMLCGDRAQAVYVEHGIDPCFVGIDTLLHLPSSQAAHGLGVELEQFQNAWPYSENRKRVIWEIAPIPLFSFWNARHTLSTEAQHELEQGLRSAADMREMYRLVFSYYCRAALGVEIPVPHFYVGSNRNGDMKLRSMLPIALLAGGPFRLFYLPYPSLFMTRDVLKTILDDLASSKTPRSHAYDYTGQYSSAQAEAEYQRVIRLAADPDSIAGLRRSRGEELSGATQEH